MKSLVVLVAAYGLLTAGHVATGDDVLERKPGAVARPAVGLPGPLSTDTREYCFRLAHELDERQSTQAEVQTLLIDGERMCREGHVPGGVARLRRAFVLTHPPLSREPGAQEPGSR